MKTLTYITIILLALSGCGENTQTSESSTTPPQPPANLADDIRPPASPDIG